MRLEHILSPPKNVYLQMFHAVSTIASWIWPSRYRDDLTIKELDETWPNEAVRDARIRDSDGWPLVIFSHGSGAYRASYIFFTEFLASQGFVVMACDHPGSARYTQVNGQIIKPGGPRSERAQMEADRPKDVMFLLDAMTKLASGQDWVWMCHSLWV